MIFVLFENSQFLRVLSTNILRKLGQLHKNYNELIITKCINKFLE